MWFMARLVQRRSGVLCTKGAPNHPDVDRFWDIVERHKVTDVLHRAYRHSRLHVKWGDEQVDQARYFQPSGC